MSEQTPTIGQLSSDGYWFWNGADWVPSLSPDRRWRWDGRQWVCLPITATKKPWTTGDRIAVALWAAALVTVSALCNHFIFRAGGTRGSAAFVAFLAAAPLVFGVVAGSLIRRDGRRSDAFGLAAFGAAWPALTLFIAWTGDSSACTAPAGGDCDIGLGLGAILVFAACYLPFLGGITIGKVFRTRPQQRQHRAAG